MALRGWELCRTIPAWVTELEPLTTGLLAQENLKLWAASQGGSTRAALGIRSAGVVYPVLPEPWDSALETGARAVLDRVAESWCLMGPALWVARCETLMPSSRILRRVDYEFLVRPRLEVDIPEGSGHLRTVVSDDGDRLFSLQEAYEKEEVLFDPAEFQPLISRLHFWKAVRKQEIAALWEGRTPLAKAGTNALTTQWAQIGGVYTRPEYRGQGLQKRLLAFLLDRLNRQGRGACLFVKKSNHSALGLYRSLGFTSSTSFTITYGYRSGSVPGFP